MMCVIDLPLEMADLEDMLNRKRRQSELDRLDLTHQMLRICLGDKLYLAPIGKNPGKVLDVGTGTGIWAIEFGDIHPSAAIIGTDLSATQPSCRLDLVSPFDFIHSRYMAAAIVDWPKYVGQVFANTKPGGWAEFQDFDLKYYSEDGSYKEEQSIHKWATTLLQASRDFGRDPCPGPKIAAMAKEAGFEGVTAQKFRLPIGPWPRDKYLKTIGSWNLIQVEAGLEAFTLRLFTQMLKWEHKEVEALLADVRKNLRDPKLHAQYDLYVVYGRRPEAA